MDDGANPPGPRLALTRQVGRLALVAIAILIVLVAGLESLCRLPAMQARLPTPSYGMTPAFDVALNRLRTLAAAGEPLDCFILGSSVVLRGMNPRQVSAGYARITGNPLRCFVLGVPALTPRGAVALAPIVLADYRPQVLVYGLSAWDVHTDDALDAAEGTDWVRYRNGRPTLRGWLTEHSVAYRYYVALRYRLRFSAQLLSLLQHLEREIDPYGFLPRNGVFDGPPGGPYDEQPLPQSALDELTDSLQQLARIAADGRVELVLIEIPTPETVARASAGNTGRILAVVATSAAREQLRWRAVSPGEVSPDGFADRMHLNTTGAATFSDTIGVWMGATGREPATPRPDRHGGRSRSLATAPVPET